MQSVGGALSLRFLVIIMFFYVCEGQLRECEWGGAEMIQAGVEGLKREAEAWNV